MQQTQRFIHSVSDLYITDEIDLLLEEIKDLEPACYQIEDLQDFDIGKSFTLRICEYSFLVEFIWTICKFLIFWPFVQLAAEPMTCHYQSN